MKNVMKRLAVCGLCVSMLAGCGKTTDTAKSTETKKNIEIVNYIKVMLEKNLKIWQEIQYF